MLYLKEHIHILRRTVAQICTHFNASADSSKQSFIIVIALSVHQCVAPSEKKKEEEKKKHYLKCE